MANVIELTCPDAMYTEQTNTHRLVQTLLSPMSYESSYTKILFVVVNSTIATVSHALHNAVAILNLTTDSNTNCERDGKIHVCRLFFRARSLPYYYFYLVNKLSETFDLANWLILEFLQKGVSFYAIITAIRELLIHHTHTTNLRRIRLNTVL